MRFALKNVPCSLLLAAIAATGFLVFSRERPPSATRSLREDARTGVPSRGALVLFKNAEIRRTSSETKREEQVRALAASGRTSTFPEFPPGSHIGELSSEESAKAIEGYRSSEVHVQWMGRIETLLGPSLTNRDRQEIAKRHLAFLKASDELTEQWLRSEMSQAELAANMSEIFAWHQMFYKELLTAEEYQQLFEISKDETEKAFAEIFAPPDELQMIHPVTPPDEIREKIPQEKLKTLVNLRKQNMLELKSIDEDLAKGNLTEEGAIQAANTSYDEFKRQAEQVLSAEEAALVFGESEKPPVK